MSIYSDLLFHHGHIADVALARALAASPKAPDAPVDAPDAAAPVAAADAQAPDERRRAHALLRRTMTALSPFR